MLYYLVRACLSIPFRTSSPGLLPAPKGSAQAPQALSSQCHHILPWTCHSPSVSPVRSATSRIHGCLTSHTVLISTPLQAHSPACAGTSKPQSDAVHWFCLQRLCEYLLSLGIFFFTVAENKTWAYINKELWENIWDSRLPNRDTSWPISTFLPLESCPQSHKQSKEREHQCFSRNCILYLIVIAMCLCLQLYFVQNLHLSLDIKQSSTLKKFEYSSGLCSWSTPLA